MSSNEHSKFSWSRSTAALSFFVLLSLFHGVGCQDAALLHPQIVDDAAEIFNDCKRLPTAEQRRNCVFDALDQQQEEQGPDSVLGALIAALSAPGLDDSIIVDVDHSAVDLTYIPVGHSPFEIFVSQIDHTATVDQLSNLPDLLPPGFFQTVYDAITEAFTELVASAIVEYLDREEALQLTVDELVMPGGPWLPIGIDTNPADGLSVVFDPAGLTPDHTYILRIRVVPTGGGESQPQHFGFGILAYGTMLLPFCPWDLNGDGVVNAADLALLLGAWGFHPGHPADFNGDGFVNAADLAPLLGHWGLCRAEPTCVYDSDCDDGNPCTNDLCYIPGGCSNLADNSNSCGNGSFCDGVETCADGVCQGGATPCAPGEQCDETGDACVECLDDSHCSAGEVCDEADGTCKECTADSECGAGEVCDETDGTCKECTADSECGAGEVCDEADGTCKECTADSECGAGEVCDETDGTCKECTADSECGAGEVCDEADGTCIPCPAETCNGLDDDCDDLVDEGAELCDDSNDCTLDQCTSGACGHDAVADGTACDDGNQCNGSDDSCTSGTCGPGTGSCDDSNACTEDTCTAGVCGHDAVADGTACDDSEFCNGQETCSAGSCTSPGDPCTDQSLMCDELNDVCGEGLKSYLTTCGSTSVTFGAPDLPGLPVDFFEPGSEPFDGVVLLEGIHLDPATTGDADTIAQRIGEPLALGAPIGSQGAVPAELVQLQLKSLNPITVTNSGGGSSLWDVEVSLSVVRPPAGSITVTKTHDNGGTFQAEFFIQPLFTFRKVGDPAEVRVLDTGVEGQQPLELDIAPAQGNWVIELDDILLVLDAFSGNFHPGIEQTTPGDPSSQQVAPIPGSSQGGGLTETLCPAQGAVDPWTTCPEAGDASTVFGSPEYPPIPADFFFPGSDPFVGTVSYRGEPLGTTPFGQFDVADTLVRRIGDPFERSAIPGFEIDIPIEIVALQLDSISPITVTSGGGQNPQPWDVIVTLSDFAASSPGTMTVRKTHANGGTWDSVLPVQAKFTFTEVGNPANVRIVDTGVEGLPPNILIVDLTDNAPWVHDVDPSLHLDSDCCTNFHPGIDETIPGDINSQQIAPVTQDSQGGGMTQTLCPAQQPQEPADSCQDAPHIPDGDTSFSTLAANTDGPTLAPFCDPGPFGDDQIHRDVWADHVADCNGNLTVTTCGQADFDTRVAVYAGCDCPVNPSSVLGCNDDDPNNPCGQGPNFHSTLTVPVQAGNCYKVRVGGFTPADQGSGTVTLSCSVQSDCCSVHGTPGCDSPQCEAQVCGIVPHCCNVTWDLPCTQWAAQLCPECQ